MVTHQEIERQLTVIGVRFTWWGRGEARELEQVIEPGETIAYCINGRYEGGFAMLCITDHRVILIDKKPLYLALEDLRYDMISEVDFDGRLVDSTITVCTFSKDLRFTSFKGAILRQATAYIQRRVTEIRQHASSAPQPVEAVQHEPVVPIEASAPVQSLQHKVLNPYTKVPFMMRRRVSRYYSS